MAMESLISRIDQLGQKFAGASNDAIDDPTLGYLTGALFCLRSAILLGYQHGGKGSQRNTLKAVVGRLARFDGVTTKDLAGLYEPQSSKSKDDISAEQKAWLAGMHFNSALHRMGTVLERLANKYGYLKQVLSPEQDIGEITNVFAYIKHDWNDAKHKLHGLHGQNEVPLFAWKDGPHRTSGIRGKKRTSPESAVEAMERLARILLETGDKLLVADPQAPKRGHSRSNEDRKTSS
jgi:hypothetical protein